jgi:hypothetical protein
MFYILLYDTFRLNGGQTVHNVQTMCSIIWLPPTLAGLHFIYVWRWPRWRHVWRVMLRPVSTRTAHHVVSWRSSSLLIGYRPLDRSGITRSWWHASPYTKVHWAPYALLKCLETRTVKFPAYDLKTNHKKDDDQKVICQDLNTVMSSLTAQL